MKYQYTEIEKPTTVGAYYYKGASNWKEPTQVVVEDRGGELVVVFNPSLKPPKLSGAGGWPADAKWFHGDRFKLPTHVTLEGDERNLDDGVVTLCFEKGVTEDEIISMIKNSPPYRVIGDMWIDHTYPGFGVIQCHCPFDGYTRWQAHPTVETK